METESLLSKSPTKVGLDRCFRPAGLSEPSLGIDSTVAIAFFAKLVSVSALAIRKGGSRWEGNCLILALLV